MSSPHSPNLDRLFLRATWIFQAIAASPIFVWLGILAIFNTFYTFDPVYDFITHICTALMAAGIIFVVIVQRKFETADRSLTLRFETAKSALATALWLWLMLDAAFGPNNHYTYDPDGTRRVQRIKVAAIASILLFVLFYPTVVYAAMQYRKSQDEAPAGTGDAERQPLLREQ